MSPARPRDLRGWPPAFVEALSRGQSALALWPPSTRPVCRVAELGVVSRRYALTEDGIKVARTIMGYFTYRLFRDVTLEQLKAKTEANLALYEPESKGAQIRVTGFQGDGCSALLMGYMGHEEQILHPIGFQFGGIWMDVRYQDGDSWDLSLMEGPEQRSNHSVNPWAYETRGEYNQEHIDFRINKVCELWPRQGEVLRPYLLPWRVPTTKLGRTRFVPRKGKAYDTDKHGYGDADQIHDFIRRFGIHEQSPKLEIGRNG